MIIIVIGILVFIGVMLFFLGLASSGQSGGISARLERYAAGKTETTGPTPGQPSASFGDILGQSVALARLNRVVEQRDFGANLARDIARADLKLKPGEFMAIWAGAVLAVPAIFLMLTGDRRGHRFLPAPDVAEPPPGRAPERVQQAAPRHNHPHRQCPSSGLVVPAGDRDGGPRVFAAGHHRVRASRT
jgi:hypothetical protein